MSEGPRPRRPGPGPGPGAGPGASVAGSPADLTPDASPENVARAIVLRQLTIAPRTRAQLVQALARRGVPDEVTRALLDRFEEVDLVDDEQFSRRWVRSRHAGRGLSKRVLAHELRTRGVADATIREAVDEIGPGEELAAARELVRRRLPALRGDDRVRRTRRLAGMLARKGYGPGTALQAIREELAALALDAEADDGFDDGFDDRGDGGGPADGCGGLGFDSDTSEECLVDEP
jgi:regulatory protein